MPGPKIGGGGGGTGRLTYVTTDTRPHVDTVECVWPGAYIVARRYVAFKGNSKMRAKLLANLKVRLIECCAMNPQVPVAPGYIAEVAHDLIALAARDGLKLS